jgi:hypothetical protein
VAEPTDQVPVELHAEGDVVAALVVDGEQINLPARAPPGRWELVARFNHGSWKTTDLSVLVDVSDPPVVRCNGPMERCQVE